MKTMLEVHAAGGHNGRPRRSCAACPKGKWRAFCRTSPCVWFGPDEDKEGAAWDRARMHRTFSGGHDTSVVFTPKKEDQ